MNKYFTPQIEDLRVGYICETKQSSGWYSWIVNDIEDVKDLASRLATNDVRTKYLDKEDIESLGWKHSGGQMVSDGKQFFEKEWSDCPSAICFDNDYGIYTLSFEITQNFNFVGIRLEIVKRGTGGGWTGPYEKILFSSDNFCKVKSINELKYIMELLDIK